MIANSTKSRRRIPLALLGALAATGGLNNLARASKEKVKTKPEFTEEEKAHLATLFGKAKKKYVAELEAKYWGAK